MQARTRQTILDPTGDTDLYVPAGVVLDIEETTEGLIGTYEGWVFPLDATEVDLQHYAPAFALTIAGEPMVPRDWQTGQPLPTYEGPVILYRDGEGTRLCTTIREGERHWHLPTLPRKD